MLRWHCRRTRGLFYLDHGLEWLPQRHMLAADGLHPSFEGVGIMASHIHELLLLNAARARRDSRAPTASAPLISWPGGHPPAQDELSSTTEFPLLPLLTTSPASNPATTTPSQPGRAATLGTGLPSPSPPVGSNSPEPKRRTYNLRRPTAAMRLDSSDWLYNVPTHEDKRVSKTFLKVRKIVDKRISAFLLCFVGSAGAVEGFHRASPLLIVSRVTDHGHVSLEYVRKGGCVLFAELFERSPVPCFVEEEVHMAVCVHEARSMAKGLLLRQDIGRSCSPQRNYAVYVFCA
ncbi:hypothetical protein HPB50_025199 [Hyalomma asiaticum]|uniref:Uncharacterized protein n=1 Tax=Hyalomma asiaticum TaxID=266040 RepID=A0ACB7S569_HYAAI|nr:hypothetical protein HPB50_025199 [Hyalomma asiaticum]